jgi:hypothetical protein
MVGAGRQKQRLRSLVYALKPTNAPDYQMPNDEIKKATQKAERKNYLPPRSEIHRLPPRSHKLQIFPLKKKHRRLFSLESINPNTAPALHRSIWILIQKIIPKEIYVLRTLNDEIKKTTQISRLFTA